MPCKFEISAGSESSKQSRSEKKSRHAMLKLVSLLLILCRTLEHSAKFIRHNFSESSWYRKYLEELCVWVELNTTTLSILSSQAEIRIGFLLIISLLSFNKEAKEPHDDAAEASEQNKHIDEEAGTASSVKLNTLQSIYEEAGMAAPWEKWSTLGEPSGKWDYYVRYDAPPDTTPIEEVAATGWGDEFSDNEVTPGKVTILEERSDWDDDERSGGKVLVIQERLAQNQQEFLDEYLPQWDEQLAIQKQELESEWENPFAAKHGENHTILHLSKEENDDDDLPYPKFRNFKQVAAQIIKKHEEHAFPSSSSQIESTQSYQPPHDSIMGPPVYPPAQQNPQPFYRPDYQFGYPQGKSKIFNGGYGEYYNSQWTLPPAWTESGVMLVLPADPGLWSEVISRWESITINRLNNQTWSDNKAKLAFVENLLGESEKLMWQQWRTAYPGAYSALEAIADEPQNI
ncbi:hypothetical protein Tco_0331204 [Tanacetum coccineum]